MKLALKWNIIEIAKSDIFTGEETFEKDELNKLMEMALIDDRPNFVELLIDNRINLSDFLSYKRLYFLYNLQVTNVSVLIKRKKNQVKLLSNKIKILFCFKKDKANKSTVCQSLQNKKICHS